MVGGMWRPKCVSVPNNESIKVKEKGAMHYTIDSEVEVKSQHLRQ